MVFDGDITDAYRYYKENCKVPAAEDDAAIDSDNDNDDSEAQTTDRAADANDQNDANAENASYDMDI